MLDTDVKAIRELAIERRDMAVLWQAKPPGPTEVEGMKRAIRAMPMRQLQLGEQVTLSTTNGPRVIHIDEMRVDEDHAMVVVPAHPLPYPMVRVDGRWRVDPGALIVARLTAQAAREGKAAAPRPADDEPHQLELESPVVRIPLDLKWGFPTVMASINGKGPYRLVLDTGARRLALNSDLAAELKLPLRKDGSGISDLNGRRKLTEGLIHVESLQLGGATFRDFDADALNLSHFASAGWPVDGFVGLSVFSGCVLTIELAGQVATIREGSLERAGAFAFDEQSRLPVAPAIAKAGDKVLSLGNMIIDTGNSDELTLVESTREALDAIPTGRSMQLVTVMGPLNHEEFRVNGEVTLAGLVVRNPQVFFGRDTALIGVTALRAFRIEVDPRSRLARLTQVASASTRAAEVGKGEEPEALVRNLMIAMARHDRQGVLDRIVANPDASMLWERFDSREAGALVDLLRTLPVARLKVGDSLPDPFNPEQRATPQMIDSEHLVLVMQTRGGRAWTFFVVCQSGQWRVDMDWYLKAARQLR